MLSFLKVAIVFWAAANVPNFLRTKNSEHIQIIVKVTAILRATVWIQQKPE
jgi:hypothetical protein